MKKGIIISIVYDKAIVSFMPNLHNIVATPILGAISFFGSVLVVLALTTIIFVTDEKKRQYLPLLWLTLAVTFIIVYGLKYIVSRPRPEIFPLQSKDTFSFPSGHAAAVFAPLLLIDREFPKLKWFWLALAIFVLISRVYLGAHYLSDVLAGALIGYIIGLGVLMITKNA